MSRSSAARCRIGSSTMAGSRRSCRPGFPQNELVFRNLAASGDEVATWHRSQDFGTRDEWLKKEKADVIFAFYGYNESFKGDEGLPKFKADLDKFLKATLTANYSGKGTPRRGPVFAHRR